MSDDDTTPVEAAVEATEATEPDSSAPDTADTDQGDNNANREAAKYRRKLRDTEAERDQFAAERDHLAARMEAMQRAEVERLAGTMLADPADLWHGTSLDELLDDNGDIAVTKLNAAAVELLRTHPHWERQRRQPRNTDALRSGASGAITPAGTSWSDALRGGD